MIDVEGLLVLAAGITHEGQQVTQAQHALRCATLTMDAGETNEMIATALVHDLAKPLSVVRHGEVMAEAMTGVLPLLYVDVLRVHGAYVADLNHGWARRHLGDSNELFTAARVLALYDKAALFPGPTVSVRELLEIFEWVAAR